MMIPYGRQDIAEADIEAVVNVLASDWLTQGPMVPRFEKAVSKYCNAQYAMAVNSATSALHLACLALGLEPGDRLWTTPNTFVASANCALYCGAFVDFVDIDPRTYNLCPHALEHKLIEAERIGQLPRIVIPVHFAGQSCDMRAIRILADRYGFSIIEDASHAMGGKYLGAAMGNCRFSDITIFSFHAVKIITTGEGGMALTNEAALAEKMTRLRSHGITRRSAEMTQHPDGPWSYQQIELGFNYRMTDIQAALGVSQMQRLDTFVVRRTELARRYDDCLAGLPVIRPWQHPDGNSAWHLYVVRIDPHRTSRTRREVFTSLRASGIGVNVHYIPVHTQPYYRAMGFQPGDFQEAERYYAQAISLPLYAGLTSDDQNFVVKVLRESLVG